MAQFVGSVNLVEGRVERRDGRLAFVAPAAGAWPLPAEAGIVEGVASIAFRPHAVRLDPPEAEIPAGALRLRGAVAGEEFVGEFTRYEIEIEGLVLVADQPHVHGAPRFERGQPASLVVPAEEIRVVAA